MANFDNSSNLSLKAFPLISTSIFSSSRSLSVSSWIISFLLGICFSSFSIISLLLSLILSYCSFISAIFFSFSKSLLFLIFLLLLLSSLFLNSSLLFIWLSLDSSFSFSSSFAFSGWLSLMYLLLTYFFGSCFSSGFFSSF